MGKEGEINNMLLKKIFIKTMENLRDQSVVEKTGCEFV